MSNCHSMKFKRQWGKMWWRVERKTPFGGDEQTCTTTLPVCLGVCMKEKAEEIVAGVVVLAGVSKEV